MSAVGSFAFWDGRSHLGADGDPVEQLVQEIRALRRSDLGGVRSLWGPLAGLLVAQLDDQDAHLIPAIASFASRDARALAFEHDHLRARIAELDREQRRGALDVEALQRFVAEVLAHHRREQKLLARVPTRG